MACDLTTVQTAACESGIGKIQDQTALLQIIAQLLCEMGAGCMSCEALAGDGSPVGAQTPDFVGQLYHDEDADTYWRSTGTTSADWTEITGGGAAQGMVWGPDPTTLDNLTVNYGEMGFGGEVETLTFNGLTTINDDLTFADLGSLTSLSFPDLTTVTANVVPDTNSSDLTTLDLSALETVGGNLGLFALSSVVTPLDLSSLTSVGGDCDLSNLVGLETLDASALETINGQLSLSGCTALTSADFSALTSANEISFFGCSALPAISFGALTTMTANLTFTDCTSLISVILTNLVVPDGTTVDFTNCALDVTSVNHILARCKASGVTACTIDLSGGTSAAPAGQGATDKADLITAGNTVTTN